MQIKAFEMRTRAKKSCLVSTYLTLLRLALLHFSSARLHADRALGHGQLHGRSCEPASPDVSEERIIGDACGQSSSNGFNDCSTQIQNSIQQAGVQSCERSNSALTDCRLRNTGNNANCADQRLGQDQCLNYTLQAYAYCGCYYSTPSDLHQCASKELKLGTSGSTDGDSDSAAPVSGHTTPTMAAEAVSPILYRGIQSSEPASNTGPEARIITVQETVSEARVVTIQESPTVQATVSEATVITIKESPTVVSVTSTVSDKQIISYFTSYFSLTFTVSESYIQTVHLHHGTPTAPDGLRSATPGEPGGTSESPSATSTPASNDLITATSGAPSGAGNSSIGASTPRFQTPTPGAITGSENRNGDGSTTAAGPSITRSPAAFSNGTATQKSVITEFPPPVPAPAGAQHSGSEQRQGPSPTPNVPPIPALSSTASEQRQAGLGASNSNNNLIPSPTPTSAANIAPSHGAGNPGPDGVHPNAESASPPSSSQVQPQDVGQKIGVVTSSPLPGTDSLSTDSPYMIGATQDRNTGELIGEIPVQTQAPAAAVIGGTAAAAKGPQQQRQQQQQEQEQRQQQQQSAAEQSYPNAGSSNDAPSNKPAEQQQQQQQQQASGSQPSSDAQASSPREQQQPPPSPSDSSNTPPAGGAGGGGGPGSEGATAAAAAVAPPNAGSAAAAAVSSGSYPSSHTVTALGTAVIQPAIANGGVQLGVMCPASSCRKRSKIFR